MASILNCLSLTLFFSLLLFARPAVRADSPESSPSPSPTPELPPQDISPSPAALASSPSPALHVSPPAPPPSDLAPKSPSPAPSPVADDGASSEHKKVPSPAPDVVGDVSHEDQSNASNLESKNDDDDDDSGRMSGGKKAGVAIGVIAAGCVVGLGALVYKKRQNNIRRAQYGYAARREFL